MYPVHVARPPIGSVPEEGVNYAFPVGTWAVASGGATSAPSNPGGTSSSSRPTTRSGEGHGDDQGQGEREGREDKPHDEKALDPKDFMSIEDYRKSRKFVFIHHFAGKNDVLGKAVLAAADVHGLKVEVISVDKEANSGNLMEAEPYESHLMMAKQGKVDGYHSGWPCSTFSRLRWRHREGLPQPVRSRRFPYGLPSNSSPQQTECDAGTIMLARSLTMAEEVEKNKASKVMGSFYTLENPPESELADHQSAWEMEETKAFIDRWHPHQVKFNTCVYEKEKEIGQRHFKPQKFVGSLQGLRELEGECKCGRAGHDPVVGPAKSKASAEYPKELCAKYADLAMKHFEKMLQMEHLQLKVRFMEEHLAKMKRKAQVLGAEPTQSRSPWSPEKRPKTDEKPTASTASEWRGHHEVHDWRGGYGKHEALRSSQAKTRDPKQQVYLGGMRHPARVIRTMAAAQSWGWRIQGAWRNFCAAHPKALEVAEQYGSPECEIDEDLVNKWNQCLREMLKAKERKVSLTDNKRYKSKLDGELVAAWVEQTQDPEVSVAKWIEEGVPLGIECPIPTHGVFPPSDEDGPTLFSEEATATIVRGDLINYVSVEDNKEHAMEELNRYESCKYLFRLTAAEAEEKFKKRTISRLGLILKEKEDKTLKKRIIVDMRRSKGNEKAFLPERLVLPRPLDAVEMIRDVVGMEDNRNYHPDKRWGSEFVLVDVTDAFMSFAVKEEEWGHCLSPAPKEGDEDLDLVCFTALLFGFKTAPLLYSRLAALVSRMLQAVVQPGRGVHQTYLDDSLWYLQGPLQSRNQLLSLVLHTMAALGLRVSFKKGKRAGNVQWVGVTFSLINADRVSVGLPEPFMKETISTLQGWASKGYVALKALRTVAGRMSWVAGVLPRTRWTVAVLYAVLTSEEQESKGGGRVGSKVQGMFPVKRLEQTRLWIIAYLEKAMEHPLRVLELRPKKMADISITTDASPECLGGYLVVNGTMVAAYTSRVSLEDADTLGFERGQSSSQGIVEALALLVALRIWKAKIPPGLMEIRVQSDSVIALALAEKLAASSPGLNFFGAELGIALETLQVEKLVTCHIPGPANTVADYLSRPDKWAKVARPDVLADFNIQVVEGRGKDFYVLPSPQVQPELWGRRRELPVHNAWGALK